MCFCQRQERILILLISYIKKLPTRNEMTKFSNKCCRQKGVFLRSCKYKSPLKSTHKFTRIINLSGGFCCCFSYSLLRSNTKCQGGVGPELAESHGGSALDELCSSPQIRAISSNFPTCLFVLSVKMPLFAKCRNQCQA